MPGTSEVTSLHLQGTTELTVVMPIKQGLVEGAFASISYQTRLERVMDTLNELRQASRELSVVRPFSDSVQRMQSIHDFRLGIRESTAPGQPNKLVLVVTFDAPWEPYIRLVWKYVGRLIDVLLCNCEGYEAHLSTRGYEPFVEWIRTHQESSRFFYTNSARTTTDEQFATQLELLHREGEPDRFDIDATQMVAVTPMEAARRVREAHPGEAVRQGLAGLVSLALLKQWYPDGTPEADILLRAARDLLAEFDTRRLVPEGDPFREIYRGPLTWFERPLPEPEAPNPRRPPNKEEIQGGIRSGYRHVTHGCLVLVRVLVPAAARRFLAELQPWITTEAMVEEAKYPFVNIAFTLNGLTRLGVDPEQVKLLPKEFREGMEARAGLLGDLRANHPENWDLPRWNDNDGPTAGDVNRVDISSVDFVLQLRTQHEEQREAEKPGKYYEWDVEHPLYQNLVDLLSLPGAQEGVRTLSVQTMRRFDEDRKGRMRHHFGYLDGLSQPETNPAANPGTRYDNRVRIGELFLGHENDRGDPAWDEADGRWLQDNGTFLVVRKLEQDVKAFRELTAEHEALLPAEVLKAKILGRTTDGDPLAAPGTENDFNYEHDTRGERCPFHAHIRRGNPREEVPAGTPVPRIVRRGMAYGPPYDEAPKAERGIMFLAYNASIAEQFEIIQRWMTGGNSTGGFSSQGDPLLGVPEEGQHRTYLVQHQRDVVRVDLGERQLVRLKWGLYLFVPSMKAFEGIHGGAAAGPDVSAPGTNQEKESILDSLHTRDAWREALQEQTASRIGLRRRLYAEIRERGGVWRTYPVGGDPSTGYGVIVGSYAEAMAVLGNDEVFSVSEYMERLKASVGAMYLGLDKNTEYLKQSKGPNAAVGHVKKSDAYTLARTVGAECLAKVIAKRSTPVPVDLRFVYLDTVLAAVSQKWFDVPDGTFVHTGGMPVDYPPSTVHCPYNSYFPSRYIFSSPFPRDAVTRAGSFMGGKLTEKTREFVDHVRATGATFEGTISKELAKQIADPDELARTIVGLIEGALPTVLGNFVKTVNLWLATGELTRIQQDFLLKGEEDSFARATAVLEPRLLHAMKNAPVPRSVHRIAKRDWRLGEVDIKKGEAVVVAIESATQDAGADVWPVFGGHRTPDGNHPTHACPGYEAGLGLLLGSIAALFEAGLVRPGRLDNFVTVTSGSGDDTGTGPFRPIAPKPVSPKQNGPF